MGSTWRMTRILRVAIFLCALAVTQTAYGQNTIYVATCGDDTWTGQNPECEAPDGPKATIQAAIDAAMDGDTIVIAPGTYQENVVIDKTSLTIVGEAGPDDTILEGPQGAPVVSVLFADSFTIEGLTITGGTGGIDLTGDFSDVTIVNCMIHHNTGGSGVRVVPGGSTVSVSVANSTISSNGSDSTNGGGICLEMDSSLYLESSTVAKNAAFRGGGIYADLSTTVHIVNSVVNHNYSSSDGGGLWLFENFCIISDESVVEHNHAHGDGGGLFVDFPRHFAIADGAINENSASRGGGVFANLDYLGGFILGTAPINLSDTALFGNVADTHGGGIYMTGELLDAHITNCTIANNFAQSGAGIYAIVSGFGSNTICVEDTLFCHNVPDHLVDAKIDCGGNEFLDICPSALTLNADAACYTGGIGDTVTVTVDLAGNGIDEVVGGQFFLAFDPNVLEFQNAQPGAEIDPESPFTETLLLCAGVTNPDTGECEPADGVVEYLVGVDPMNGKGASGDAIMAVLTFIIIADNLCNVDEAVAFDHDHPHHDTKLTAGAGATLLPDLLDLQTITIDSEGPQLIGVPDHLTTTADAGFCDAVLSIKPPMAEDNCGTDPVVTFERSDDAQADLTDPFPVGTTIITWTATDQCGNVTTDTTEVTVLDVNEVVVEVTLQGAESGPFTRCIAFELTDELGSVLATVETTMEFINGSATGVIEVPCGMYGTCVQVRNPLHTLRSQGELTIDTTTSPDQFVASDIDPLLCGDLNDDGVIDIIDFGIFVYEFNNNPVPGAKTDCDTEPHHADMTGSGIVELADFTCIQTNFLLTESPCAVMLLAGQQLRPRLRISVRELKSLGLGHLKIADLNNDGWLDQDDIAIFMTELGQD